MLLRYFTTNVALMLCESGTVKKLKKITFVLLVRVKIVFKILVNAFWKMLLRLLLSMLLYCYVLATKRYSQEIKKIIFV